MLSERLGLTPVGIDVPSRECLGLTRLQELAETVAGRRALARTHLRIYTAADYIQRWNDYFGWDTLPAAKTAEPNVSLLAEMGRKGISKAALAKGIEADASFVGKIIAGRKQWPAELLRKAKAWIADLPAGRVLLRGRCCRC